jgi:hypothetical protein
MIKSRGMEWVVHVALQRREEGHTGFWLDNVGGKDHMEELGVDGKIILKWI